MISFKEFFLEFYNNGKIGPHHRSSKSLYSINTRGNNFTRNGEGLENANIIAKRYNPNDPNYNQNKNQKTGPISNNEASELISKHNIKSFPARLGKRPFMLIQTPTGYSIQRIK
jgi:hypothetical protein